MSHRPALVLQAMLAALVPICLSVFFAYQQSLHVQETRANTIASEALSRSGKTSEQLLSGFNALVGVDPADACSPSNILRMRRIALAAPFLAGIGYISNETLGCSSFGGHEEAVPVGPADLITAKGYAIRHGRELSIAPGTPLVLLSDPSGFTGFFHPALVLTMPDVVSGMSVGMVTYSARQVLMATGPATLDWSDFSLPPDSYSSVVHRNGQIVAAVRSRKWDSLAYAAIPITAVSEEFRRLLPFFLPFGLLLSIGAFILCRQLSAARTSLPALLRQGLQKNEVYVELQPIVDMASGRWVGAEVLARWRRANGEHVPPDVFIPLAETEGLITEVTRTVLRLALGQMSSFIQAHDTFFLTINFSAADLQDSSSVRRLEKLVRENLLQPKHIHFEITERQVLDSDAQISAVVELRSQGFEIGTDDFGVGCSNLGYLNSVPLDYVKIDRSLMTNSLHGDAAYDIVDTIVSLARARGIEIIAEGVETESQSMQLVKRGVRLGQGWLFARAMQPAEFIRRFESAGTRGGSGPAVAERAPTLPTAA